MQKHRKYFLMQDKFLTLLHISIFITINIIGDNGIKVMQLGRVFCISLEFSFIMEILISCLTVMEILNLLVQKFCTRDRLNKEELMDKASLLIYKVYINMMDLGKIHNQLVEF